MCKASLHAEKTRKAVAGEVLAVGTNYLGMGAFHPPGVAVSACLVCVEMGAELTLSNIPQKARELFGLSETEDAVFYETEGSHTHIVHDLVLLPNHPDLGALPLAHFAGRNTQALMKQPDAPADVVEGLMKIALEPRLVSQTPTLDEIYEERRLATVVE